MKLIKNEIRPIGFVTVELTENEIQSLIGVFEENCYILRRSFDAIKGTRGELYAALSALLSK